MLAFSLPANVFASDLKFSSLAEFECTKCHKENSASMQGEPRTLIELNKVFQGMKYEEAKQKLKKDIKEHKQFAVSDFNVENSLYIFIMKPTN